MKKKIIAAVIFGLILSAVLSRVFSSNPLMDEESVDFMPPELNTRAETAFSFAGRGFSAPVYIDNGRYYLAIEDIVGFLGGTCFKQEDRLTGKVAGADFVFSLSQAECTMTGKSFSSTIDLVDKPIEKDGEVYTCLSNLTRTFGIEASWDFPGNKVVLWPKDLNAGKRQTNEQEIGQGTDSRAGYLRLEDIYCDGRDTKENEDYQLRLRAIADLLYQRGVPFHVAWIPRCVFPEEGLDNDPETNWNICNAGFIYTLDYMQYRGGTIGLHGYTHSGQNMKTAIGTDFGPNSNTKKEEAQAQMDKGKKVAYRLKIPIAFFEFPHYTFTETQLKVAEKNFRIIYQPKNSKDDIYRLKKNIFVGTPLGYLAGAEKVDEFLNNADQLIGQGRMGSFFFHPHIEDAWITPVGQDGKEGPPDYIYQPDSPLQRILDFLVAKNISFKKITEIK